MVLRLLRVPAQSKICSSSPVGRVVTSFLAFLIPNESREISVTCIGLITVENEENEKRRGTWLKTKVTPQHKMK